MPGQRRTAGPRSRGSWLPRLAGIGLIVILAAGGVTAYLVELRPAARPAAQLPSRVLSFETVGLIAQDTQPGSSGHALLQLLGRQGTPQFTPVGQAQEQAGSPQWTADQMAGNSYIFIFLPTGDCLAATGPHSRPKLALRHCDLAAGQRWRRTRAAVLSQGHDFYQYANLGDAAACLTQAGPLSGQAYGAALATCSSPAAPDQLIAFWSSSV